MCSSVRGALFTYGPVAQLVVMLTLLGRLELYGLIVAEMVSLMGPINVSTTRVCTARTEPGPM